MSQELQKRLRELRATNMSITPDKVWVQATRKTLMMQVKNTLPAEGKATLQEKFKYTVRYLIPQDAVRWVSRPIMAVVALIMVLAGGSIMSVSAAEQSLPGDMLYGLKLATEQARLAMTSAKEDKLKLKTEFTGRRVEELKKVAAVEDKKTENVMQVAEILKRDLNTLKEQLDDVSQVSSKDKVVEAAKLVDQKTNEVITALADTKEQLSPETKEKVTEAQSAAADTGVKALEVLVEQHQEDSELVTVVDVAQAMQDHARIVTDATMTPLSLEDPATASSTTSTTVVLADMAATTTASTTSESLPALIGQIKDATTQAFSMQKAKEQLETAAANSTETAVTASTTEPSVEASSTEITEPASTKTEAVTTTTDKIE